MLRRRFVELRGKDQRNYRDSSTDSEDSPSEFDNPVPPFPRKNRSVLPSLYTHLVAFPSRYLHNSAPLEALGTLSENIITKNRTRRTRNIKTNRTNID